MEERPLESNELRRVGLKVTHPRMRILELLEGIQPQHHLTAEDIYRHLLENGDEIGLATVYRVLMQFEQAGLLSRHHFEAGKAVYELREDEHHDHLVCLDCGHVEEFHDPEIEKRQTAVAKARGFTLVDHALSLYAHCTKANCPHRGSGAPATRR